MHLKHISLVFLCYYFFFNVGNNQSNYYGETKQHEPTTNFVASLILFKVIISGESHTMVCCVTFLISKLMFFIIKLRLSQYWWD